MLKICRLEHVQKLLKCEEAHLASKVTLGCRSCPSPRTLLPLSTFQASVCRNWLHFNLCSRKASKYSCDVALPCRTAPHVSRTLSAHYNTSRFRRSGRQVVIQNTSVTDVYLLFLLIRSVNKSILLLARRLCGF